jgi:hypothetical protein
LWMHTLVELWAWKRSAKPLTHRADSPWDDADRRPSHADRRKALQAACLQEEFSRRASPAQLPRKIRTLLQRLLRLAVWSTDISESADVDYALFNPTGPIRLALAGLIGIVIAAISGSLGIAGGEMRIPALIYLFAVPIKDAGTLSLMVSIPTVASGAAAYRRMGHIPNRALGVSLIMGLGSILGVLIGAALLPYVDKHVLKGILGTLLLLATLCLTLPWLIFGGARSASP